MEHSGGVSDVWGPGFHPCIQQNRPKYATCITMIASWWSVCVLSALHSASPGLRSLTTALIFCYPSISPTPQLFITVAAESPLTQSMAMRDVIQWRHKLWHTSTLHRVQQLLFLKICPWLQHPDGAMVPSLGTKTPIILFNRFFFICWRRKTLCRHLFPP